MALTLTQFLARAANYTAIAMPPYSTDTTEQEAVANEVLKQFSIDTLCLFDDNISFVVSTSTGTYSLRDTGVFGKPLVKIGTIWVNNSPLTEVQQDEIGRIFPGYLTSTYATGQPAYWFTQPPHHMVTVPISASAYTGKNFVSGWYVHPTITAGTSLEIPDEALDFAAIDLAVRLARPRATGDALIYLRDLQNENDMRKRELRARMDQLLTPYPRRRRGRTIYSL